MITRYRIGATTVELTRTGIIYHVVVIFANGERYETQYVYRWEAMRAVNRILGDAVVSIIGVD